MKFSYQNLKIADNNCDRIGNWKGLPVFASSYVGLRNKGTGAYFIVYDDDNAIVKRDNRIWYQYGSVSSEGVVSELNSKAVYIGDSEPKVTYAEPAAFHPVCGKTEAECNGTVAKDYEAVTGDVKLEIDVEATLKAAREMTLDSLLEGFNYGLDEAKG